MCVRGATGNVWIHPTPVDEAMERCAFEPEDVFESCVRREVQAK